jgi:hypothetical protein
MTGPLCVASLSEAQRRCTANGAASRCGELSAHQRTQGSVMGCAPAGAGAVAGRRGASRGVAWRGAAERGGAQVGELSAHQKAEQLCGGLWAPKGPCAVRGEALRSYA